MRNPRILCVGAVGEPFRLRIADTGLPFGHEPDPKSADSPKTLLKMAIAPRARSQPISAMWTALTIIAVVGLLLFGSDKQSPVRGSLTLGLVGGLIAAGV